tara:strand:+ start:162 stop:770 length:609 start_codon:yes stop_codon:yes gene_type:complete
MAERLDLIKDVFNKAEYIKTIDTSFNELGTSTIVQDEQTQPTVEEFFRLYNSLFYDIPALGETNSHDYIVKTSGEYINFEENNEEIQALQAEIAQLRSDLLSLQIQAARSAASPTGDESTNEALLVFERELQAANENIILTETNLSQNTLTSLNTPGASTSTTSGGGSTSISSGGTSAGAGGASGGGASGGGSSGGGGGGGY